MNAPNGDRYLRRFQDAAAWPSNVVYGLYAEVVTEKAVNELAWEQAGHQVADEASAFLRAELRAERARQQRHRSARAEGFRAGEPGE